MNDEIDGVQNFIAAHLRPMRFNVPCACGPAQRKIQDRIRAMSHLGLRTDLTFHEPRCWRFNIAKVWRLPRYEF